MPPRGLPHKNQGSYHLLPEDFLATLENQNNECPCEDLNPGHKLIAPRCSINGTASSYTIQAILQRHKKERGRLRIYKCLPFYSNRCRCFSANHRTILHPKAGSSEVVTNSTCTTIGC